jgi:CheY-like chemotaxis protein
LLFKKYSQADASTARHHGGSGLGLSICRELVQLMGGSLGVESQPGSGSTFHFSAQFEIVSAAPGETGRAKLQSVLAATQRPEALHGAKVLLAEDTDVNQLVACEMLRGAGIEVLVAENGRRALELLREHPDIELVLMDCHMPVMDGFAATRAIRSHPRFHALPVVAMTANVLPDDLLKCRGVGMNDYVGKPFHVQELFDMLARWLGRSQLTGKPPRSEFAPFDES